MAEEHEKEKQAALRATRRRQSTNLKHAESFSFDSLEGRFLQAKDDGQAIADVMLEEARDAVGTWVERQNMKETMRQESSQVRQRMQTRSEAFLKGFGLNALEPAKQGENISKGLPTTPWADGAVRRASQASPPR
jgi:hypothetical protein